MEIISYLKEYIFSLNNHENLDYNLIANNYHNFLKFDDLKSIINKSWQITQYCYHIDVILKSLH